MKVTDQTQPPKLKAKFAKPGHVYSYGTRRMVCFAACEMQDKNNYNRMQFVYLDKDQGEVLGPEVEIEYIGVAELIVSAPPHIAGTC